MSGRISSATEHALRLIAGGSNPHAASKVAGITPATIYRALKRIREAALKKPVESTHCKTIS